MKNYIYILRHLRYSGISGAIINPPMQRRLRCFSPSPPAGSRWLSPNFLCCWLVYYLHQWWLLFVDSYPIFTYSVLLEFCINQNFFCTAEVSFLMSASLTINIYEPQRRIFSKILKMWNLSSKLRNFLVSGTRILVFLVF